MQDLTAQIAPNQQRLAWLNLDRTAAARTATNINADPAQRYRLTA